MTGTCDDCAVHRHLAPADGPSDRAQLADGSPPGVCSEHAVTAVGSTSAPGPVPGLADTTVARLLSPVLPPVHGSPDPSLADPAVCAELFARVALSTAVEPGDQEAGRLLEALGPLAFVSALVDGTGARGLLEAMRGSADGFARSVDLLPQQLHDGPTPRAPESGAGVGATDWAPSLGDRRDLREPRPTRGASKRSDSRAERRLEECLSRWRSRLSLTETQRVLERAARIDSRLLTPRSPFWPPGLDALEGGAPVALWVRGDPSRLARLDRSIAVVGARAATAYGEHVAGESAAGLADRGFAIVSGGAYGIDAAAHRATVASGGVTVAFLAGGVDRLYPAGNSELLRRIAATGVLVAELPPGSAPTRWRFMMRNRLIAASATATVVVEAGHRSGSLNTAGHAAQLGRPLGAVPGSVLSPASAGTHRLIREYAATCVTTVEEMAELADPLGGGAPPPDDAGPSTGIPEIPDPELRVIASLSSSRAASADDVAARAGLPFTTVAAVLGRMDLAGRARERAGGWVLIGDQPRRASR